MKLNLGCDIFKIPEFVNIDLCPDVKPDLVADVSKLSYEDNSIEEIYSGHILEHFSWDNSPLKEWYRILKPNCKITITVPDVEKGLIQYRQRIIDLPTFNSIVFGSPIRNIQLHLSVWTEDILIKEVSKVFGNCKIIPHSPYLAYVVGWQTICEAFK
jgi:ubiquinone/menaquinone biosynthesis C-methylase UbiE